MVLGLNIWTTNDNALYASGLGFANITGMSSKTLSVINGIIGTVCALWLYNNFVGWLTFLSAAIPPVGGVIIADYLMNRRRYEHFATTRMMSVNWWRFWLSRWGLPQATGYPELFRSTQYWVAR